MCIKRLRFDNNWEPVDYEIVDPKSPDNSSMKERELNIGSKSPCDSREGEMKRDYSAEQCVNCFCIFTSFSISYRQNTADIKSRRHGCGCEYFHFEFTCLFCPKKTNQCWSFTELKLSNAPKQKCINLPAAWTQSAAAQHFSTPKAIVVDAVHS